MQQISNNKTMIPKLIQDIEKQIGHTLERLEPLPDLSDAVRYERNNSYSVDAKGKLLTLNISESEGLANVVFTEEHASLEYVNLSENKDLAEVRFEVSLPKLKYLDLSECGLTEVEFPAGFAMLEKAYLQQNKLKSIQFQGGCPKLIFLDLSQNELETFMLPGGFFDLAYLYLNDNKLRGIKFRKPQQNLEILHLRNNNLESLSFDLLFFEKLQTLYLHNNKELNIPQELIASDEKGNSWPSLRSYMLSNKKSQMVALRQAKMVLVGNGEVGKSSIRIKLLDPKADLPQKHERTQGLDIATYTVESLEMAETGLDGNIDFQLNIWDFGGQGKYREVQQLFCSRKSLYLFVTAHDDTPGKDDYVGFDYWLSMVNAYSYDERDERHSPIIHVVNKIDEEIGLVEEKTLKDRFPNINSFVKISCKKNGELPDLKKAIRQSLKDVSRDVFTYPIAELWMAVKTELENKQAENYIYWDDYWLICREHGLEESEAQTWIEVLDRIGTVIYFGKNEALSNWVILNPIWVKDAIYKVLDSLDVENGILKPKYLTRIWDGYTEDEREKLVELILAYKLCYQQKDQFGKIEYVIPALLSEEKPIIPNHLQQPDYQVKLVYKPFIPAGTVNKLMVALNNGNIALVGAKEMIEHLQQGNIKQPVQIQVYNDLLWKNNVIVHDPAHNAYAQVTEDWEDKTVYINLYGDDAAPLFEQLSQMLEAINHALKNTKYLNHLCFETFGWRKAKWRLLSELKDDNIDFFTEIKAANEMNPIQELIAQGRLKDALNDLTAALHAHAKADATQLRSRLSTLERKEMMGIISNSDANLERNTITAAALALIETKPFEENNPDPKPPALKTASIYFSYAWGDPNDQGESREQIVNDMYDALVKDGFNVLRDKMDLEYGGLISEFMEDIGEGDLIIVFMSDKYLRSAYCMWELCEIHRNSLADKQKFSARILPVRVENLEIGKPKFFREFFTYWDEFFNEWNEMVRDFPQQVGKSQLDEFNKSRTIKDKFGDMVGYLQDMNSKTKSLLSKDDFEEVKKAITARLNKKH